MTHAVAQQPDKPTQEQYDEFGDFMATLKDEVKPLLNPIMDKVAETNDPAELESLSGEIAAVLNGVLDRTQAKLEEIVTPEQLAKMRQFELQQLSGMASVGLPVINFDAYKGLGLSESQVKELENIRAESKKEQIDFMNEMFKQAPKRPGAGRPKGTGKFGAPTKAVRLPIHLIDKVLIYVQKELAAEKKASK